jgi:glucosamine--fructose-6-phosphate aminotransferase (isomerizing)
MEKYTETLTYKDISEIPNLINQFDNAFKINKNIFKKYKEVYLLGRGSSGNATLFAKYVWEIYCGVISNIVHPFSIFNHKKKLDFNKRLLFSLSQSGRSPDIVKCSKIIKDMGAKLIGITNESDLKSNPLAKISEHHILLSNSKEIPVAATKSFILQLWAVLRLSNIMGASFGEKNFMKTQNKISDIIQNFETLYNRYKFDKILSDGMTGFVGRGPFNAIAEDSALKFREMAQIHSLGYSAAEFLHGPVGSFTSKDTVIILSGEKRLTDDLILVKEKLQEKRVNYIILEPFSDNYPFNALETDVFLKLTALKLAVKKGLNPDNPKGLSKVTYTL